MARIPNHHADGGSTSRHRSASHAGIRLVAWSLGTVAALLACAIHPGAQARNPELRTVFGRTMPVADFERIVDAAIAKAGVAGLSVAIVNDRKIVYTRQFGWKDKDAGTRLNDTTVFAGASLSKTVFAYLTLLLTSDGLIALDKPLAGYLLRPLATYAGYADLANDDRYHAITARMVLSHTTGLPNQRSETADGRLRLRFQPGSRFHYSGEGFQLLQLVVETVTKSDLETLARDRVFRPFGMARTSYVWRDAFASNIAAPHNEFEWASDPDRPPTASAAGSLLTTAHDYARFLVGVLAAPGRQEKVMETMFTPTVSITSFRMFGGVGALSPANAAKRLAWALGWGTFETPTGRAVFHTGHKGGAQNYAVAFLDRGAAMVLLSNSDNFESVAPEIVAAGLDDRDSPFDWLGYQPFDPAMRKAAPPRLVAIKVPASVLAAYAGEYQLGPDAVTRIKADGGRLYASDDGQSWDELLARSETVFFFRGRTLTITFAKDASGMVTHLDVNTGAATLKAQRIR
jgi:CubicO group peptidase (beta-lactamase class C family)